MSACDIAACNSLQGNVWIGRWSARQSSEQEFLEGVRAGLAKRQDTRRRPPGVPSPSCAASCAPTSTADRPGTVGRNVLNRLRSWRPATEAASQWSQLGAVPASSSCIDAILMSPKVKYAGQQVCPCPMLELADWVRPIRLPSGLRDWPNNWEDNVCAGGVFLALNLLFAGMLRSCWAAVFCGAW